MARVEEFPLTDVALIELKVGADTYTYETATEVNTEINIQEGENKPLTIKGVLVAQKSTPDVVTGVTITTTNNTFSPSIVELYQGGTVTVSAEGEFVKYQAPPAGVKPVVASVDEFNIYTEVCDTGGHTGEYMKISFPNGKGKPMNLTIKDGEFYSNELVMVTAPNKGQSPYTIEKVATLPATRMLIKEY